VSTVTTEKSSNMVWLDCSEANVKGQGHQNFKFITSYPSTKEIPEYKVEVW